LLQGRLSSLDEEGVPNKQLNNMSC